MKKLLLIVLVIIFSMSFSFAGEWDTDFYAWGIGVLIPTEMGMGEVDYHHFYFPQDVDIPVFAGPEKAVIGTISIPKKGKTFQDRHGYFTAAGTIVKSEISYNDLREVYYESRALKIYEEKDGYVRILHHSLKTPAWIKLKNLEAYNIYSVKWMDFMTKRIIRTSFNPHNKIGMNLRSQPEVADNKLVTMKGDLYDIQLTGVTKGLWAEVTVNLYDVHPCRGDYKTLKSWTGWVKLLDDSGYPNIWFYTRGC